MRGGGKVNSDFAIYRQVKDTSKANREKTEGANQNSINNSLHLSKEHMKMRHGDETIVRVRLKN